MKLIHYIRIAIAKYHMSRYCKLMSKVIDEDISADDIYKRLIKY